MLTKRQLRILVAFVAALVVSGPTAHGAQKSDVAGRDMNASAFFQSRPKSKSKGASPARRYRKPGLTAPPVSPAPPEPAPDAEVGFTIWKLRPPTVRDPVETKDITHMDDGQTVEWVAERLSGVPVLSVGQRFRFAIETPRKGYLYVVNRPHYADGPREPMLIFPTTKIRSGANEVQGGRVVELPSRWDRKPYFDITTRGDSRLVAEEVIVLVTPKPLDLEIGEKPLRLEVAQVEAWERRWGARAETFEQIDDGAATYTAAERAAGLDASRLLTQDDPGPQKIYRIAARPGDPLFLRVLITIRDDR